MESYEIDKKPNYKEFVKHVEEWDKKGIPWGTSDLKQLAKKYNTPIPNPSLFKMKERIDDWNKSGHKFEGEE